MDGITGIGITGTDGNSTQVLLQYISINYGLTLELVIRVLTEETIKFIEQHVTLTTMVYRPDIVLDTICSR